MREDIVDNLRRHIQRMPNTIDFADLRCEIHHRTTVELEDGEIGKCQRDTSSGFIARILKNGMWSSATFDSLRIDGGGIDTALKQTEFSSKGGTVIAPSTINRASCKLQSERRYSLIPIEEKVRATRDFDNALKSVPNVSKRELYYSDSTLEKYYVSTEGAEIMQEQSRIDVNVSATSSAEGSIGTSYRGFGSGISFGDLPKLEMDIAEVGKRAVRLSGAKAPKAGKYQVVFEPELTGTFVHEAIGHGFEADVLFANYARRFEFPVGKRLCDLGLNVMDDPTRVGSSGYYEYDDEGVKAHPTSVIRDGAFVGWLQSRETAGAMGQIPTGNARAISHRFPPIVRMSNTFIEPADFTFGEMLEGAEQGIYAIGSRQGRSDGDFFVLGAQEAYLISHGQLQERLTGFTISGRRSSSLRNINAIGKDLSVFGGGKGGCVKLGQGPLPMDAGGPHIRVSDLVIQPLST